MKYFNAEKTMNKYIAIVTILMLLGGRGTLLAQTEFDSLNTSSIFRDIQNGLTSGNFKSFSKHFSKQVYIDLPDEESAYFSGNQVYFILQNFFGIRRLVQFKFTTIDENESGPFATGGGTFMTRGHRETLQIYVALSNVGGRWLITQFNVY
jgi:hypothetical protein